MLPGRIVSIREGLDLTQAQLAQLLGVHPLTVSKWERGVLTPSPYQVDLIESFAKAKEKKPGMAFGAVVAVTLATVGAAAALFVLLRAALDDEKDE